MDPDDRYYILVKHTPVACNIEIWSNWFKNNTRTIRHNVIRRPKTLVITEEIVISTVFLGLNHAYRAEDDPILFETMIFGGKDDQYCERYTTWNDAIQGHRRIVKMVKDNNVS